MILLPKTRDVLTVTAWGDSEEARDNTVTSEPRLKGSRSAGSTEGKLCVCVCVCVSEGGVLQYY